jgi:hypothetical protein
VGPEHPLGNNELIAARKNYLHLMLAKGKTSTHERDDLSAMRMMRIVNRR